MIYLEQFELPSIDKQEAILSEKAEINGGQFGYVDNTYPCGIFSNKEFYNITFKNITIFYGGNGSGKSTLLNIIANKLNLKRVSRLIRVKCLICLLMLASIKRVMMMKDVNTKFRMAAA